MIKKYRKKPVVIEAIQFFGMGHHMDSTLDCIDFCNGKAVYHSNKGLVIETLEGSILATDTDYIIKGVKGEFYPCKPDIFEMTYQELEESEVE